MFRFIGTIIRPNTKTQYWYIQPVWTHWYIQRVWTHWLNKLQYYCKTQRDGSYQRKYFNLEIFLEYYAHVIHTHVIYTYKASENIQSLNNK
jgi:hypothetical protein